MSTPVKNGRGVLARLPNGLDRAASPGLAKNTETSPHPTKKAVVTLAPSAEHQALEPASGVAAPSSALAPEKNVLPARRPSISSLAKKRCRPSPHMKRVSFGGNTVNIIQQHRSEFKSPDENDEISSSASPPRKIMKESWSSSSSVLRSPMFMASNPDLLNEDEEHEDTITVPDAQQLAATRPVARGSPRSQAGGTPVPSRRISIINPADRKSFGIFVDEEVSTGINGIDTDRDEDKTLLAVDADGLRLADSPSDESDGDVTQDVKGISALADEDDQMASENELFAQHSKQPAKASARSVSSPSSRTSLSYIAPRAEENSVESPAPRKSRWSIMPLLGNDSMRLSRDPVEEELADEDATIQFAGVLDRIEDDEKEEEAPDQQLVRSAPLRDPSAPLKEPSAPLPVKPVLPDNRQLFDSAEDPTIHFYPEDFSAVDADRSAQSKHFSKDASGTKQISELKDANSSSATNTSTPMSATGAKVRALRESSAVKRGIGSAHLQGLSSVAKSPAPSLGSGALLKPKATPLFTVSQFLEAGQVHFDRRAGLDLERPSLGAVATSFEEHDKSSRQWKTLEAARRSSILGHVKSEVSRHLEMIEQTTERLELLETEVVNQNPAIWQKMSQSRSLSSKEMQNIRFGLKRLQKVATRKARLQWVTSRQEWEGRILNNLKNASAALNHRAGGVRSAVDALSLRVRKFHEEVHRLGHKQAIRTEYPDESFPKLRSKVVDEFSRVSELRQKNKSELAASKVCRDRIHALVPERQKLVSLRNKLEPFAGTNTNSAVRKILAERRELNAIVCGVSGIRPVSLTGKGIRVTIADMMDLRLEFEGDRVVKVASNALSTLWSSKPASQPFVEGAVKLSSRFVKELQFVRQVPVTLHACSTWLRMAWKSFSEADLYFDANPGELLAASTREGDGYPSLDLSLAASFYSLRLEVKFDVHIVVSCSLSGSDPLGTIPTQSIKTVGVTRFIGTLPSEDALRDALEPSSLRMDERSWSIGEALSRVWQML